MRPFTHLLTLATLLLLPAPSLLAQPAVDPSGHWEGTIQAQPNMAVKVEIDLAKNGKGEERDEVQRRLAHPHCHRIAAPTNHPVRPTGLPPRTAKTQG